MNWIKNNPFVGMLAAITIVVCGALFLLGSKAGSKYKASKEAFDQAAQDVATSERLPLYPTSENRDSKRVALTEYGKAIETLRELYDPYRVDELQNVSPQEFTEKLKEATTEVTSALTEGGGVAPDGFLLGFERYASSFASGNATGVLQYQLDGIKHALLKLAEARPSQLLSVYREPLKEEDGGTEELKDGQVSRAFGFEVTFKGSEAAARKFLTSLGETEPFYYVVRTLKVENERKTPPTVADAKFEQVRKKAEVATDNPFGGAFTLPGFGDDEASEDAAEAEEETTAEAEEEVEETDSSRILAQVLGSEEVIVFVRFDLMMFLPKEELPTP